MEWPEEGARVYNVAVGGVITTTTFHIPTLFLAPKGAQEEQMLCVSPSVQCSTLCSFIDMIKQSIYKIKMINRCNFMLHDLKQKKIESFT